ncbi:hypothetical protein [Saccharopolyspora shandongensis]|uniref:hypothetical protein n=1 Tax=Saccharopolyspora shandongensis TaxID=418495 RepID=UPI0033E85D71
MERLVDTVQHQAVTHGLVLVPAGMTNTTALPVVELGPRRSGHDLGEWVEMMVAIGARALYLVDGARHFGAMLSIVPTSHPSRFELQAFVGGVLHTWTTT